MRNKYLRTTKQRDTIRIIIAIISFIIIIMNIRGIQNNYNELYEIEREGISEYNFHNEIKPSNELKLERDNMFNLIEICANMCLLVLLYAGRVNMEGTRRECR